MIWFTSDLHLSHNANKRGHGGILHHCPNRKFDTLYDMEEHIIKCINNYCQSDDTLIVVGDFCLGYNKLIRHFAARLPTSRILVIGNHDKGGFTNTNWRLIVNQMEMTICKQRVLISHWPYQKPWYKRIWWQPSDNHKRPKNKGQWLIHGHRHSGKAVNGKSINVCWDIWNRPVSLKEITKIIDRGNYEKR